MHQILRILLLLLPFLAQAQQPLGSYTWLFELPEGATHKPYSSLKDGKYMALVVDGKTGLYSLDNKWVIEPLYFQMPLHRGNQLPVLPEYKAKWGLLDLQGQTILAPTYDKIGFFTNGLAPVKQDDKLGFIDTTGKLVIPCQFEDLGGFYIFHNMGCWISEQGKWGLINKKGEWIIQPTYDDIQSNEDFPLWVCKDGLWGVLAGKDKWAIAPKFKKPEGKFTYFHQVGKNRPNWVTQDGKWGAIDHKGNWVIDPAFDKTTKFVRGRAFAQQNGKWGIINLKGKWVVNPQFDDALGVGGLVFNDKNGLAIAAQNGQWGLVDTLGKWRLTPEYSQIYDIGLKVYAGSNAQQLWGFINERAKPITSSFLYQELNYFAEGYAVAKKDGLWGVIDEANNLILPFVFSKLSHIGQEYAVAELNGKTGIIKFKLPKPKKKS